VRTRARMPVVERRLRAPTPWLGARVRRTSLAAPVRPLRVRATCLPRNGTPIVWPALATMPAQRALARAVRRRCVTAKPRPAVRKSRYARRLRRASVSSATAARTHSTSAPTAAATGPARKHSSARQAARRLPWRTRALARPATPSASSRSAYKARARVARSVIEGSLAHGLRKTDIGSVSRDAKPPSKPVHSVRGR
jgi:hypothetical protein